MLASCFLGNQVFHLKCHSNISSQCECVCVSVSVCVCVCVDNRVVLSVFLFSELACQYVAVFMKHAMCPQLHEDLLHSESP
jgi:hypothetical protein